MLTPKFCQARTLRLPSNIAGDTDAASLARQIRGAREILKRLARQPGVVLADDAGLGKTWVAALAALAVAHNGGSVLIVVPGKTLQSKWKKDIGRVTETIPGFQQQRAPRLQYHDGSCWEVKRTSAGGIVITTHAAYTRADFPRLSSDLLIVDEAHRSKHESSNFKEQLAARSAQHQAVLYLTATPFSIHVAELVSMLAQVSGGKADPAPITAFAEFIRNANAPANDQPVSVAAAVAHWRAAVAQLVRWVMRTTIDQLPAEERKDVFGERQTWHITVPDASPAVVEALIRADRLLSMAGRNTGLLSNDPRFHVGWRYLDSLLDPALGEHTTEKFRQRHQALHAEVIAKRTLAQLHASRLRAYLHGLQHEKIVAVAHAIADQVARNEKVVVFCHHLATARELRIAVQAAVAALPQHRANATLRTSQRKVWKQAWLQILAPGMQNDPELLTATMAFVTTPHFHRQVRAWLDPAIDQLDCNRLLKALRCTPIRRAKRAAVRIPSIADAVIALAKRDKNGAQEILPAALDAHDGHEVIFPQSDNLYSTLAIFGTPFGPEVLIATDKLSEGIDLHRYCRILVHYELDPSPVRVRQREGRVRRVNSWAALVGQPVLYAYPAYGNTRDAALVRIIRERLGRFDVLLGGAPTVTAEETELPPTPQSSLLDNLRDAVHDELKTCLNSYMPKHAP